VPLDADFNHFGRKPNDAAGAARQLLLDARAALFDMQRDLAESKKNIAQMVGAAGDTLDKAHIEKAKAEYISHFRTHVVDSLQAPGARDLMKRMYGLYERMFPIEDEREDLGKLLKVLAHNEDAAMQAEGAPFRQQWIIVENKEGEVIAARYVSTFSLAGQPQAGGVDGTQHLTYSFVDPKYRAFGLGDHTMKTAEEEARRFIAASYGDGRDPVDISLLQFCEQNAPLKMTGAALLTDTIGAKTDQFWRRDYYEKMGFRQIRHDYIQAPLRARDKGGEPVDFLDLLVRARPPAGTAPKDLTEAPAAVIAFHIYNTAKRSFAAQQYDVDQEPGWLSQQ